MTRPDSPLQRHLLTRSDLARMAIPAASILAWLAAGALEPVGNLGDDTSGDPVFTVTSPELRRELLRRLADIDKNAVVLTPMRVRSFLVRARLATTRSATMQTMQSTAAPVDADPSSNADESILASALPEAVTDRLTSTDLATVLHEVAAEIEADVEVMLRLAEEEAQLEAEASQPQPDTALTAEPAGGASPAAGLESNLPAEAEAEADAVQGSGEDPDHACFDIDDLADAFEIEQHDVEARSAAAPDIDELAPSAPVDHDAEPGAAPTPVEVTASEPVVEAAATAADTVPETPGQTIAHDASEPPLTATENGDDADAALQAPMPSLEAAPTECSLQAATEALIAPMHDDELEPSGSCDTSTIAITSSCEPETSTMVEEPRLSPPSGPTIEDAFDALIAPAPSPVETAGSVGELSGSADALDAVLSELGAKPPTTAAPVANEAAVLASQQAEPHVDGDAVREPTATPVATAPVLAQPAVAADLAAAAMLRTNESLGRVESFLGELKSALIELAHRPAQPSIDVKPLVVAVQTGFEHAAEQTSATNSALTLLSDRIGGLGRQIEHGIRQVATAAATPDAAHRPPAHFVVATKERMPIALLALAALVSAWSVLFWFKTGSIRLALGTLIAANLLGCYLLLLRRQR